MKQESAPETAPSPGEASLPSDTPLLIDAAELAGTIANAPVHAPPPAADLPPSEDAKPKRGRGRPPGSKSRPRVETARPPSTRIIHTHSETGNTAAAGAVPTVPDEAYTSAALATATTITTVAAVLGGEDWQPAPHETSALSAAFERYYRVRGLREVPPEVSIATALLAYGAVRLQRPAVKERVGARLIGLRTWWAERVARRATRRAPNARPNPGPDRNGEIHAAASDGSGLPPERDHGYGLHPLSRGF